ncbi:carboxylesterase [Ramlibacter sp. AW1]|uniref:Carboxylesterase n=1 Tax=Ramlibacter aurantiacus TaxID=2801330 RepID=A0A937D2M7_9BURK|nr:PHB depolymerase family esterase [Ramlibacter aurantiacus]MBL0419885.1 carboxylesterase [Ramlibacter aurantiacus]
MSQLDAVEIETGPSPVASMIVLHGLGADGHDFEPVVRSLSLAMPVRFVLPHAPVIPVTVNNGFRMRAWYDITGRDGAGREDEAGLRGSAAVVQALLAREEERGVPAERIVLAGFSQGCAMSLLAGLRYPRRLAGIVGLSGYLPLAATTAAERSAANAGVPIFLAHGRHDEIVSFERALASRDLLQALEYPVRWHEYPIGHAVSPQEIADLQRWLLDTLAAPE